MKPAQLPKKLFLGALAFSVLIAGCDKASKHSVKALISGKQTAQQQSANYPPCNDKVNQAVQARILKLIDINKLIAEAGVHDLTADQKNQLQKMVIDLKTLSDAVVTEIKNIKQTSGVAAVGCNQIDSTNPSKKIPQSVDAINSENVQIARKVAAITKLSNTILDGTNSQQDPAAALSQNQKYKISSDFGDALSESNKDGKMYILDGKIVTDDKSSDELSALIAKNEKAVCSLQMTSGKLKADDVIVIQLLNSKDSADQKITSTQIIFANADGQLYSLACSSPKSDNTLVQLRTDLGALLTLVIDEAPMDGVSGTTQAAPQVSR
ncbi:MAG: hypothetical protein ACXVAX_10040 [Pseudobdellovibrio sp.]